MYPKISIVTPSYNQGEYIEETICSVLDQQYPNLEYIIIDGGSSDKTVEIIKRYEKYLKYWVSESDKGQSHAINKGLSHCTGEIFNWLNSDDLVAKGSFEAVASIFTDNSVDIVSGREIHFSEEKSELRFGSIIYDALEENLVGGVIYQPSTFWRFSALKELLPINKFHYLMDTDLWTRYILKRGTGRILKTQKVLARFRLHPGSKTTQFQSLFQKERWVIRKELFDFLQLEPFQFSEMMKGIVGETQIELNLASQAVDFSHGRLSRRYAEELAYYFYIDFDYQSLRKLLLVCNQHGLMTRRLFKYYVKINMIPRSLLNAIRS